MRNISIAALAAFAGTSLPHQAQTPLQIETATWEASKQRNTNALKAMYASNYVGLYDDGAYDLSREVQTVRDTNLRSFKITGFRSQMIDPDDMLMTYSVDMKGNTGKEDFSGKYHAASVWHRVNNKWLGVFHVEVKAK